ncbi:hypothetical protein GCM10017783_09090 [Deinococcus piscis]|uniref:3D domain-containing protein n=2 Tax=Deinococcus piscis TaxID=394230 RepID=A0ABQ3K2H3_9DEIO|nr:hypothetical protein GCM10017783_09090 [Deinococcus piscis]
MLTALAAAALGTAALNQTALALPPMPAAELADRAVQTALSSEAARSLPYVNPAVTLSAEQPSDVVLGARAPAGRTAVLKSTAYNSLAAQTDSTPHITATGTRTRPGVVALSRDMLRLFPYGTRLRIQDLSGNHPYVNGRIFVVEDTMHARKSNQIDVWMPTRSQAMNWGVRNVRITVVR